MPINQKREWEKPVLTVLLREPQVSVLSGCKNGIALNNNNTAFSCYTRCPVGHGKLPEEHCSGGCICSTPCMWRDSNDVNNCHEFNPAVAINYS